MKRILKQRISDFLANRQGIAATEFALILPVQLALLFGTVELANILIADRKVTYVASAVADLVAQTAEITDADIADVFFAAESMLQPFDTENISVVVASVEADGDGNTSVGWSDGLHAAGLGEGTNFALPNGIVAPNQSVVVALVNYQYESPLGELITGSVNLEDTFYLAPRRSVKVERVDE